MSDLLIPAFLCAFFLSSQYRLSSVSAVFDFNDSLNDFAPMPSILLSVDVKRNEKIELLEESHLCVLFLLSSQSRLSSVSVVFDFNDSLNDFAPVSPVWFSV